MKSIIFLSTFFVILILSGCSTKQSGSFVSKTEELGLIPLPDSISLLDGFFKINKRTKIVVDNNIQSKDAAIYLQGKFNEYTGIKLAIKESSKKKKNCIVLAINNETENQESYELKIEGKTVIINGRGEEGLFYGIQTFLQLALANELKPIVPFIYIKDKPEFKWRGIHLDVCRHFFPVETVKKLIDISSMYKFNKFHWHLTEDQGWRIEIKSHPKLTAIGAWRDGTLVGHAHDTSSYVDSVRYGGFYTQEEIKEVIAYARSRHIEVIPEIEMPGHAIAALASYPEYSCTVGPFKVAQRWGVFEDVFCAGKDETFTFLESVLDEVIALFPSEYVHIGGDECPKTRWEACKDCQNRIKVEHLKNEHELQSYFIRRIEEYLNSKGKKLIGWDEILEGGLTENATVMSWRGYEGGIEAVKNGHEVIMTPYEYCYLNFYQTKNTEDEPLAIGGYTPLEKVYGFNPVPSELSSDEKDLILGAQANIWTEYIDNQELLEYMVFPRLCAMSEVLWTSTENKNYDHFHRRLTLNLKQLELLNINYHPIE